MDNNLTFMKYCKSEFEEFTSHVSIDLEKKDKDYKKVVQRNKDILNKYPKIRDLFENNNPQVFNEEESLAIAEYYDNSVELRFKEYEEVFYKGFREAYYFFERGNMIKEYEEE